MDDTQDRHETPTRRPSTTGSLLFFFVKFLVLIAVLFWTWMEFGMPRYAGLIAAACPPIFDHVFGHADIQGRVDMVEDDLLNSQTALVWMLPNGYEGKTVIGRLVANIPPYVALVLATSGILLWRRIWVLCIGLLVLAATHIGFVALAFEYRDAIRSDDTGGRILAIPQALAEFSLTLPFLLWIILVYWEKLGSYFSGATSRQAFESSEIEVGGAKLLPDDDVPHASNERK